MLGVFQKQKGVKVVVGDTNQQIYGWRYAVNSLESPTIRLTPLHELRFQETPIWPWRF